MKTRYKKTETKELKKVAKDKNRDEESLKVETAELGNETVNWPVIA